MELEDISTNGLDKHNGSMEVMRENFMAWIECSRVRAFSDKLVVELGNGAGVAAISEEGDVITFKVFLWNRPGYKFWYNKTSVAALLAKLTELPIGYIDYPGQGGMS